jgi:Uma2 family endonuclease
MTTLIDEIRANASPALFPISVDMYHGMINAGLLRDGDPVELLDGMLVRKDRGSRGENVMTHNPRHALLVARLTRLFASVGEATGTHCRIQLPVTLNEINQPEPDAAVIEGPMEDFAKHHPAGADILLVVEVADSSLRLDRTTKQRLYATAGVPHYWLINLPDNLVETFSNPNQTTGVYETSKLVTTGQMLSWTAPAGQQVEINVSDLLK